MIKTALSFLTGGSITRLLATVAAGMAVGAWGAWELQALRMDAQAGEYAEQARQRTERQLQAERMARADEMVKVRNTERIADEQARREKRTAARVAVAERAAHGLRAEIARLNAGDVPEDPRLAALTREARTARDLLGRCGDAYRRVDGRAQELGDQVTGLQDFVATSCGAGQSSTADQDL